MYLVVCVALALNYLSSVMAWCAFPAPSFPRALRRRSISPSSSLSSSSPRGDGRAPSAASAACLPSLRDRESGRNDLIFMRYGGMVRIPSIKLNVPGLDRRRFMKAAKGLSLRASQKPAGHEKEAAIEVLFR